jgi:hypothetical protein
MTDERCDMCYAQKRLQDAMNSIEAIPDFDIALFEEQITRAYVAMEISFRTLAHYPHDEEASR